MRSSSENGAHVLVIPYPQPGHMHPQWQLIHQLASRGLTFTVLISPKNLPSLNYLLSTHPHSVQTLVMPFPSHLDIPPGVENMQEVPLEFLPKAVAALSQLYDPIIQWYQSHPSPPVAIFSDTFLATWTLRLAQELGIQRIGFHPMHAHPMCAWIAEMEASDEPKPESMEFHVSNAASWGLIVNSFYELEKEYLDQLTTKYPHDRIWAVGPLVHIENGKLVSEKVDGQAHEVITWLDSCPGDRSVVYVGFGSQITLSGQQMEAVAAALETSGVTFVWSVKDPLKGEKVGRDQSRIPDGFEDRVAGRGFVIKGWAPQTAILSHRAIGAYLTHCGCNSAFEGIIAGVLLLAWPMQADHPYNAKLLVDELGAAKRVCEGLDTVPDPVQLARVLKDSISGSLLESTRAMELQRATLAAVQEGGSSYKALDRMVKQINELPKRGKVEPQ